MSFWYPKMWNDCTKGTVVFLLIYRQWYISLEICLRFYLYIYMYKYTICIYVHISSRIWKGHHHLAPNHVPILVSLGNAGQSALCFCCQSCKASRSNSEIDDNQKIATSQFSVEIGDGLKTPNSSFNRRIKHLPDLRHSVVGRGNIRNH